MREAIILAGGKGTRLNSVICDLPKPMAPVDGRPFLEFILDRLIQFNFNSVILSVGFKADKIISYFGDKYFDMPVKYMIERSPLGTGGAIKNCLNEISVDSAVVLNGDTYSDLNYDEMLDLNAKNRELVIGAIKVKDVNRYGALEVKSGNLIKFIEKGATGPGIINAGCYVINKNEFSNVLSEDNFSFEEDYLKKIIKNREIKVFISQGKFIDIGIPDDYFLAQNYLKGD